MNESEKSAIEKAVLAVQSGFLVVFPTETVYGVGAHPDIPEAVERIYSAKGRDPNKPLQMLVADMVALRQYNEFLGVAGNILARRFWPGPLTMVVDIGNSSEGLRIPDHPAAQALIRACGGRLRASSANISGRSPATSAREAASVLGPDVRAVVDFGPEPGGIESTVLRVTGGQVTVLREGVISREEIEKCLGK